MPVQIACPKCTKRYSLPDSALGKAVQCKSCGTTFRTKKPGQAQQPAAPAAPQRPAANEDLSQFGLDGGFQKEADIFNSPPPPPQALAGFGNFAEEDPGFDEDAVVAKVAEEQEEASGQNPYQSILNNPALRQTKKLNKKGGSNAAKIRRQHIEQETEIKEWGVVMMVLGVLGTLSSIGWIIYGLFVVGGEAAGEGAAIVAGTMIVVMAIVVFLNLLQVAVGWGMHRLNGFGRIGGTIYWGMNLINLPVGTIISIIVLRLLWNEKAKIIFSPEYQAIRDETPEIKHKSSTAAGVIGLIVVVAIIAIAGYFFGGFGGE